MPKVLNYRVIIEQDEDGVYVASVPSLQGCYTEGDTFEEAIKNVKDVIKLHIAARKKKRNVRERLCGGHDNHRRRRRNGFVDGAAARKKRSDTAGKNRRARVPVYRDFQGIQGQRKAAFQKGLHYC